MSYLFEYQYDESLEIKVVSVDFIVNLYVLSWGFVEIDMCYCHSLVERRVTLTCCRDIKNFRVGVLIFALQI